MLDKLQWICGCGEPWSPMSWSDSTHGRRRKLMEAWDLISNPHYILFNFGLQLLWPQNLLQMWTLHAQVDVRNCSLSLSRFLFICTYHTFFQCTLTLGTDGLTMCLNVYNKHQHQVKGNSPTLAQIFSQSNLLMHRLLWKYGVKLSAKSVLASPGVSHILQE